MPVPYTQPGKPGYRIEVSWTWRSALQRSAATLRERGVRSFLIKALGETIYRRLLVLECHLRSPPPPATTTIPATFHRLRQDEAAEYAGFRADTSPAEVRSRLARGMDCFIARHRGRIACASWAARGSGRDAYLQRGVRPRARRCLSERHLRRARAAGPRAGAGPGCRDHAATTGSRAAAGSS